MALNLDLNNLIPAILTNIGTDYLGNLGDGLFGDSDIGRGIGTIFSQGVSSAGNTIANNILKGTSLTQGLGKNVGSSVAGAGAGLAANYIGKGITSALGDSKLARGIGQGVATGLGTIGGQALGNLIKTGTASNTLTDSIKAIKTFKELNNTVGTSKEALGAAKAAKMAGVANLAGLGMTVAGTALGAALGPSKEYGGKYGNITQISDMAYDAISAGVNFIPGAGQVISGALALNKGLSNLFGSTSGMTVQDAILGSAFMPAPVKWLNMWGANTTSTFNNLSWQNSEKTKSFMGNAFGNLLDKFDLAREEAGKTYGTFSSGAYHEALDNINFANRAWDLVLAMADLNELQNIRSQAMSSINNQRYAQDIQGGWSPVARGKYGMKIFNNATNHNIGMRLLSSAALIDNKQMILSAQTGIKIPKLQTAWLTIEKSDNTRVLRPVVVEPIERKLLPGLQFFNNHGLIIVVEPKQEVVLLDNRDSKVREKSHKKSVQVRKQELMKKAEEQTAQAAEAILEKTMPSYWVEKAIGEDLGTVGSLAVDLASPFVLGKGVLLLGKTGQILTKVPNIIRNRGFAVVENTPWNTTKIKWKGLGNNSYIELENNGEWLKPKMMESTYHGTGRKLYDAAIGYALNNGYKGIMSGENLLSAPKTYNIWRHYPNKILLLGTGSHSNAKMTSGSPFYKEVSTEKELLDATKNNVKAYREGPIMGLTEPSLRIYLRNEAGLLVKVPINKFTTAKSIYNEGNMTPVEVLQATGKGISDVYKTYSPGGAWYLRLLANGVPKEEVDRLASEYLKNLRKTTFEVTDSPLSDAVAVTGGEIRNGEMIPKITMDPRYAPNALLVRSAASHEGGHASTLNLEPKNSPYREPEHEGFYLLVEKENPEITKAMEYNESLRPLIKDAALDELILDETGNVEKHLNNVVTSLEIRQRALASEIDASNKGVTMNEYINNPNLWDLNFKQLMEIFEKEGIGIRNYMLYFKSLTPTIIGGTTAATLYNKSK